MLSAGLTIWRPRAAGASGPAPMPPFPAQFTAFDPFTTVLPLSNGDLTVTGGVNTAGIYVGAFILSGPSSGKFYHELSTTSGGDTKTCLSIANAIWTVFPGDSAASLGYFDSGAVYINNVNVANIAAFSGSCLVGVATDYTAKMVWFQVNGGNWNNNPAANPATGAGGIDISGITPGPYFFSWANSWGGGAAYTATGNFGASAFTHAAPSGFTTLPGPTSPPAQAVAWSLNTLLWDANLNNYDAANTKGAGFDLYLNNAFPSAFVNGVAAWAPITAAPATHAADVSVSGSKITLATDRSGIALGLCSVVWNGSAVIGKSFVPPFYIEVIMSFDPSLSTTGAIAQNAWPIIWMVPTEFLNGSITTADFVEIDNNEMFPSASTNGVIVADAGIHDWNNNSAVNNTVLPGAPTQAQIGTNLFNRYGKLVIPKASNSGTGIVATYFNDGHTVPDTNYTAGAGASPAATPSNPAGTLSALDGKHYALLLGAGQGWPITVSRIRVWGP